MTIFFFFHSHETFPWLIKNQGNKKKEGWSPQQKSKTKRPLTELFVLKKKSEIGGEKKGTTKKKKKERRMMLEEKKKAAREDYWEKSQVGSTPGATQRQARTGDFFSPFWGTIRRRGEERRAVCAPGRKEEDVLWRWKIARKSRRLEKIKKFCEQKRKENTYTSLILRWGHDACSLSFVNTFHTLYILLFYRRMEKKWKKLFFSPLQFFSYR